MLKDAIALPKAKVLEQPKKSGIDALNRRIAQLSLDSKESDPRGATQHGSEQQSPESAQPVTE